MKLSQAAIAVVAAGLACGVAHAQDSALNLNGPLEFSSDNARPIDPATCTTSLTGRVEINADRTRLRADSVVLQHQRSGGRCGKVSQIDARGQVFYVTPERRVRADTLSYNQQSQDAVFSGSVVAVQGEDVATSEKMTINLGTNAVALDGRVHGVFYPQPAAGEAQ